ncbi:hypothetical protein [Rhizobium tumorigenes]|uniref:Uncharacterized protein n=1 Tax=Rhizobium tumorigenes TaxID=2041385 RepID=A0AAF1K2L2_9HYPH|nr:hypothetical protein [Rhizobium tumorigenes]WFR94408.1 hypothetical protein PR017_11245 [Rhizobium tumorigenes]
MIEALRSRLFPLDLFIALATDFGDGFHHLDCVRTCERVADVLAAAVAANDVVVAKDRQVTRDANRSFIQLTHQIADGMLAFEQQKQDVQTMAVCHDPEKIGLRCSRPLHVFTVYAEILAPRRYHQEIRPQIPPPEFQTIAAVPLLFSMITGKREIGRKIIIF